MKLIFQTPIVFLLLFTFAISTSFAQTIVPYGSTWKYLDTDTRPAGWELSGFADGGWASGAGQLGYGDGDEVTVVACAACNPKYITTYFRKTINITDPTIYTNFTLNVKRDDGVVVYINGTERYANNMPAGRLHSTLASATAADDGNTPQTTTLASTNFIAGNNVIAVEIHQSATNSSDITFDLELIGNLPGATTITRGPYLQIGNQTDITLRWRTAAATNSRITWGTVFGTYPNTVDSATVTTEHIVKISGLTADTKYYYTVGSTTVILEATANNFFLTLPASSSTRKIRVLAFGDCGNNSTNQANVRDAFISYANTRNINPDAWLLMGDNAYNGGLDGEFTSGFFNIYNSTLLKNIKLYPSPGNHDYDNLASNLQKRGVALPYYDIFSMPTLGEIGGVASNTEAFYSFNIQDIHFVSLDSYGTEDGGLNTKLYDTTIGNKQADWLRNDLAVNNKKWTIVYFHHPPYTKGSHDSDLEGDLISMHNKIPAILERYGVDLVINGHSHVYERSFLLKNLYGNSSTYVPATHLVNGSSAKYNGLANSCPYAYQSGQSKHGTVYVVSGSSGQLGGSAAGWPLSFMSAADNTNGGSFYFEVDSNRLDAKFISYTTGPLTPFVRDSFTIFKDVNKVTNITVAQNAALNITASWRGNYYWPNNAGATTQSVTVNTATPGTFDFIAQDASSNGCIKDSFHVVVNGTLPILLNSFTATLDKNKVLLDWSTQAEQNNKYFAIEKSNDAINFNLLGRVNGAGTSASTKTYRLIDYAPAEGVNYYRLSQTNYDGNTTYFETKKVVYKSSKNFSVSIINVSIEKINLLINSNKNDNIKLKVVDMLGKEIAEETLLINAGINTKVLQLQTGAYIILLTNSSGERISSKVIIK